MGKIKVGQCYLCGSIGEMTKEHVPPKFLSPKSPNSEFAFVSVCKKDNNINSHQESMFRDFVVTAAYSPDNKDTLAAYDAMMRNFTRNPTAQAILGKPNKDLLRVFSGMRKEALRTPAGIYLGTGVKISPAKDLDWKLILTKIAKSLHFLYTGEVVPSNYRISARFIEKIAFPEMFNMLGIHGRAGNFFHFKGGWPEEDKKSGLWYMVFYKKIGAEVMFLRPS